MDSKNIAKAATELVDSPEGALKTVREAIGYALEVNPTKEQAAIAVAALMASVVFYAIKKNYSFAYDKLLFTAPSAG